MSRNDILQLLTQIDERRLDPEVAADKMHSEGLSSADLETALKLTREDLDTFISGFEGAGITAKKAGAASYLRVSTRTLDRWHRSTDGLQGRSTDESQAPSIPQSEAALILGFSSKSAKDLEMALKAREPSAVARPLRSSVAASPLSITIDEQELEMSTTDWNMIDISQNWIKANKSAVSSVLTRHGSGNDENGLEALVIIDEEGNILAIDKKLEAPQDTIRIELFSFITASSYLDTTKYASRLRVHLSKNKTGAGSYRGMIHSTEKWVITTNIAGKVGGEFFVIAFSAQETFRYGQMRSAMDALIADIKASYPSR